ncbi:MAG: CHAT domain-containing protein [Fimbriimonadales bacterium]
MIADHLRNPHLQGQTRLQHALVLSNLYRYDEALSLLQHSERYLQQANATVELGQAHYLRAFIAFDTGDLQSTRQYLERAYRLFQQVANSDWLTRSEYLWGLYYRAAGSPELGIPYLRRALNRARKSGNTIAQSKVLLAMGILYRAMEQFEDALAAYEQALRLENHPLERARLTANIGLVYWSMGLYPEARAHYTQAMPIFRETQSLRDVATCLMNSGLLLQAEGDIEGALAAYEEALTLYQQIQDAYGVGFCELNRSSALIEAERYPHALQSAQCAIATLAHIQADAELTICRINQASALIHLGQLSQAQSIVRRTLQQKAVSEFSKIQLFYLLGETQRKQKRFREAEQSYTRCLDAIERFQAAPQIPVEERALYLAKLRDVVAGIGAFWAQRQQFEKVFEVCQRGKGSALRMLRPLRTASALPSREQARLDRLQARWEQAQSQLQSAKTSTERRRHQQTYAQAYGEWTRLRQQMRKRYPQWQLQQNMPLTPLQVRLDSQTAVVEYLVGEDAVAIAVLNSDKGRNRLEGAWVAIPRERLEQTVRALVSALEQPEGSKTFVSHAKALYEMLFHPVERFLKEKRHLVICGDGVLHSVPWGVLIDKRGRYLVERYAINSAPSASAWAQLQRRAQAPSGRGLLVALSQFEGLPGGARANLGPLPGVVREKQILQTHWQHSTVLAESQATRPKVLQSLPSASVIHMATHAVPNNNAPMQSAFALHKGWLYAQDVMLCPLNAELAVLSACATAQGTATADGLLGLGWAFLFAGCRNVVATLWKLPDAGVDLWMDAFYKQYRSNRSAANALRHACLRLLKHPRYAHPRYWSAWTCLGKG